MKLEDISKEIHKASQLLTDAKEHELFAKLCMLHEKLYGNKFTYTLLDMRAALRKKRRYLLYGALGLVSLLGLLTDMKEENENNSEQDDQ